MKLTSFIGLLSLGFVSCASTEFYTVQIENQSDRNINIQINETEYCAKQNQTIYITCENGTLLIDDFPIQVFKDGNFIIDFDSNIYEVLRFTPVIISDFLGDCV